jgi:hypothetical protein
MEPLVAIGGYIGKKGIAILSKKFSKDIVERWSRTRAINFFGALVEMMGDGSPEIDIALKLDALLESKANQEMLFEAYRLVCLSKSREIGPRAIALLSGQIILEGRQAAGIEEPWFEVFETFSEMELIATYEFYEKCFQKVKAGDKDYRVLGSTLQIKWASDDTDAGVSPGLSKEVQIDRSTFNFHEFLGPWARKLSNLGIIHARVAEELRNYRKTGNLVDSNEATRTQTYWIDLNTYDEAHAAVIARAHRMVPLGAIPKSPVSEGI